MRRIGCLVAFAFALLADPSAATVIAYEAFDLADTTPGQDLWKYRYHVSGKTFAVDEGFDVFFPLSAGFQAGDLAASPAAPNADWDVISLQPDAILPSDGRYDALALVGGASLADVFEIAFTWRGAGQPGSQLFEVYANAGLTVAESGHTIPFGVPIPAPATGLLLLAGLGGLFLSRRDRQSGQRRIRE